MRVPLELSFRQVPRRQSLERLIHQKAERLNRACGHLTSCRVAVERPHQHECTGCPYRVRLDLTVPPGHRIVVTREAGEGEMHERLEPVIRNAFDAARRRLVALTEKQRGEVKSHVLRD